MVRPARLRIGDTVGVVSPSSGSAGAVPHRVERGLRHLEALGFKARLGQHALNRRGFVSDTAEHRADDLHAMFRDPDVRAIVAAIGGDHSCHLLPLVDFELIRANPKIFMGYSDITVLNIAIWQATGLVTFNGPMVLSEFAEHPQMFEYTQGHMLRVLGEAAAPGPVEASDWWTEEFLDWKTRQDLTRPRQRRPAQGWTWLRPGHGEGRLIGGCLESLEHLRGTPFWPDWEGAAFFWETSEEKPTPATVDAILMDYENMGVLGKVGAMLVGRPMGYTEAERQQLREVVLARTSRFTFPIVTDMDFGHTAPQFTLPIGCRARIDSDRRCFEIIEAAVA